MDYKFLKFELDESVGIIFIDNPKANAISSGVIKELVSLFSELENNDKIRSIVITGQGNKFFVAGADIKEFLDKSAVEGKQLARNLQIAFNLIENFPKPVIAAVNGYCLGGGLELAMCCDIRYASENALFGQPEIDLGLIPGAGGTQRLPKLIGKGKAKELMYTGKPINAKEALELQLVQKIFPLEQLLIEAKLLAKLIAKKSPLVMRLLKEVIDKGTEVHIESGLVLEANNFGLCFSSNDKKEGVSAFLEKREPNFTGK